jgi:hypothetical protein
MAVEGALTLTQRRAFTLTEAIAAVVILAVAMPPMLWALQEAHLGRAGRILATRAVWLAAERIEDIIADRHASGFNAVDPGSYAPEDPVPGFPGFSRSVSVSHTGADLVSPGTTHARVAVRVSYTDGRGIPRTVELETVLADMTP